MRSAANARIPPAAVPAATTPEKVQNFVELYYNTSFQKRLFKHIKIVIFWSADRDADVDICYLLPRGH